jgi:alkylated DNA repair dioxygenase AlkB
VRTSILPLRSGFSLLSANLALFTRAFRSTSSKPISIGLARRRAERLSEQFAFFENFALEPDGLRYAAEFVSPEAERKLISRIQSLPLEPFEFGQFEGKRRVASFGFRYDYASRQLRRSEPIPTWLHGIIAKIEAFDGPDTHIQQVLCTEYGVGVGIGWHRDKPHFERIFGLSLGSPCKFRFRKPSGKSWDRFTLDAEPRSLYMMSGASRRIWEHSIPAVESPRYSITFRTMSNAPDRAILIPYGTNLDTAIRW